ncbi:MAG: RRXRR domain-containing protein [Clostridiales bacterium]|jgi:N6-L-threonylcarbamoyladenine synthase|nr:RRXRR domain-containing protein [Clostridiales bacterium]
MKSGILYDSTEYIQPINPGEDAGSKTIGKEELYAAEAELRAGIADLLSTRRVFRSARRNVKARHRLARFNGRVRSKHKGWLAPSTENKIQTHIKTVDKVHKILPIAEATPSIFRKSRILIYQERNAGKAVSKLKLD